MDSRMGLSIPEDKEFQLMGSWIPSTPGKPIPVRPNLMPVGSYGNQLGQANWQETARLPSPYLREVNKYNGHIPTQQFGRVDNVVPEFGQIGHKSSIVDHFNGNAASAERKRVINHLAGAYTPALHNVGAGGNYHSLAHVLGMNAAGTVASPNNINMANSPTTSNFQSPINWGQRNRDGFPIPHHPFYNLKTLPRMENTAASSLATSVQLPADAIDGVELEKGKLSVTANLLGGKCSTEGEGAQSHLLLPTEDEAHQHHLDGLPNNIVNLLSATGSTTTEEPKVLEIGESSEAIDLNKTPVQKPPKQRKHRPKVVVEGKAKRAITKATISEEKPTGKRKYVRKAVKESATELADKPTGKRKYVSKKIQESETQQTDSIVGTTNFNAERNSCRRALNFDVESNRDETQGREEVQKVQLPNNKEIDLDLNVHYTATESSFGANKMHRTSSASHVSQLNKLLVGIQQEVKTNSISSTNQTPSNCLTMSEGQAAAKRAQREHMEMKDLFVNMIDAETNLQQHIHMEGIGQIVFPATTNSRGIDSAGQSMTQNRPQPVPRIFSYPIEGRGSKREHYQIDAISPLNSKPGDSLTMRRDDHCQFSKSICLICPETHKKHRVEHEFHSRPYVMPSPAAAVERSGPRTCAVGYTAQYNSNFETDAVNRRQNSGVSGVTYNHLMTAMNILSKSQISSELYTYTQRTGETSRLTQSHSLASLSTMKNNMLPPIPKVSNTPGDQLQPRTDQRDILRQQQTTRSAQSLSSIPRPKVNMVKQQKDSLQDCQQPSANSKGQQAKQKVSHPIEEIIHWLEGLHLSERTNEVEHKEQNALVLYKGDGTIVPYEIKKRKPRPKVDLDMETERVWKLLMGKEGSEGLEETDKDKAKWWEEERKVFNGRADSFIARMHLVQGDRRFSKWKGSVVDSVIGVFLTQNVSDHLSSSAFMSLAARFPLRPTSCSTCDKELTNIMVEQPDIGMQTRETIKWIEELLSSSNNDQSTLTLHESAQDWRDYKTLWMDTARMAEAHSHSQEEEVLSSQGSSDSLTVQANGVGSSSGSNSEAEDLPSGSKPNTSHTASSTDHLQIGSTNLFEEFYSGGLLLHERSKHGKEQPGIPVDKQQMPRSDKFDRLEQTYTFTQSPSCSYTQMKKPVFPSSNNGQQATAESGVLEGEGFQLFREESISSWSLFTSRFGKEASYASQGAERMDNITAQKFEQPRHRGIQTEGPIGSLNTPPEEKQSNSQPYYENQLLGRKMTAYHLEMTSAKKPVNIAEAPAKQPDLYRQHISNITKPKGKVVDVLQGIALVDKETQSGNKLHEQTKGDKLHSTDRVTIEANKNASKARKRKAEEPPKNAVEWDNLRKDAKARNGRKERSKDTMDSLDYESLRSASVSEISEVIKERGMNNMLAERIKEFLNRLVRDHGSIDLEWLRDVPPEKAKDYLLSIRGLGLKSVECVRLLTLHHLAFPVDTNVGRIVVRLGWVPLQPLPESLQLHLLELYPVLESIQKYLWPRLCKLDQRTLYELHYQLITFGKVFCTKSRPNCNACPMRAECRHFASAFASARLALPGPEEKSLTTSTAPLTTEKNPGIGINHMLLPQPEDSSLQRAGGCMPIIEEPATPEQEQTEVTVTDIEDAFGEDPDEIPTIRLNMEEFSASVQNYVQANMEIQEGDMSKALVVLNTNAASIPTPKLKNVSRLRTEHHVYELPDSHPILKGMDRREPDDPSPYLLAIWTPGETSDSIQLPEQQCESHVVDRLCNSKMCFSCSSIREANAQTVRGTLLIPCRTAMRGSFPLNGTYFQVNEMFADHESSLNPLDVPRSWIWNLPRRMVYFGTSVSSIFKGLSTQEIQYCFWKGFVCVRGFDQKARAPRPLVARLHFPASKMVKAKNEKR